MTRQRNSPTSATTNSQMMTMATAATQFTGFPLELCVRAVSRCSASTSAGMRRRAIKIKRGTSSKIVEITDDRDEIGNQVDWAEEIAECDGGEEARIPGDAWIAIG